jgi:peptidoglycan/xylan/chitin deacetylase (PgdA/CDA1 family)
VNIGLKIDVDTYRGTRKGVPALMALLKKHEAGASFLFNLGPDHTGRAIGRLFRRGFLRKAWRTSALSHYGLITSLRGTLLPGVDIGRRCADLMRSVRDAGFEVGIHSYDHVRWQDGVAQADAAWTRRELERACQRFRDIFGAEPRVHGAAGWRMNRHAYRLTQGLGFGYCSDTRGTQPFVPLYQAEIIACPQLPTTLPTLDELIGTDGITRDNVADHILQHSRNGLNSGHVYTARAELEGIKLAPAFERLLQGWREMGCRVLSLADYFDALPDKNLPRHEVAIGTVPGRSEYVALQGEEFLAWPPTTTPLPQRGRGS